MFRTDYTNWLDWVNKIEQKILVMQQFAINKPCPGGKQVAKQLKLSRKCQLPKFSGKL